ncbi:MarC family protein [Nonomuraea sp. NPDC048881]|uniref:MarC family protein n=1 Tax=Nonomuraea sp. NPDC048881 TaxID=3155030 RepID=UPI0033CB1828
MSLFVQAFVTLLVIFDPLAAIPIFLTLARSQDPAGRRRTARVSVLVAAGIKDNGIKDHGLNLVARGWGCWPRPWRCNWSRRPCGTGRAGASSDPVRPPGY